MFCEQFHDCFFVAIRERTLRSLFDFLDEEIAPKQGAFDGETPPDQKVGETVGDDSEIQRVGRQLLSLLQVDPRYLLGDTTSEQAFLGRVPIVDDRFDTQIELAVDGAVFAALTVTTRVVTTNSSRRNSLPRTTTPPASTRRTSTTRRPSA